MKWIAVEPKGLRIGGPVDPDSLAFRAIVTTEPLATQAFDVFSRFAREDPKCLPPVRNTPPRSILADLNGIAMADRHTYEWRIDGLPIFAPAVDLEAVRDQLYVREPERAEVGGIPDAGDEFYVLPTRFWNVLLTPKQRKVLLGKMDFVMQEAIAISAAETTEFNRRFAAPHPNLAVPQRPVKRKPGRA